MSNVTFFIERPRNTARSMASYYFDSRKKFRLIITVSDAEGRTLDLVDEITSQRSFAKNVPLKCQVRSGHIYAHIHPLVYTVVVEQNSDIHVKTIPVKAPRNS